MLDHDVSTTPDVSDEWPHGYGICHCGCGRKTAIPSQTSRTIGRFAGVPSRYISGHNGREPVDVRLRRHLSMGGPGDCWEWTATRDASGYGQIWDGERLTSTHRIAWAIENGAIPDGLCVLHRCDNPPCCNPAHLFLGTKADNTADMVRKGRARGGTPPGEQHHQSKLTATQVVEARELHASGRATIAELARRFGISHTGMSYIIRRKNWRHV